MRFPDSDLLQSLVQAFFDRQYRMTPLVHRPTLERGLALGLHLRDPSFANVVMGVCACAARNVDDPRVLLEGSESWHSAGWKYYNQIRTERNSVFSMPSLYDLQTYGVCPGHVSRSETPGRHYSCREAG